MRAAVRQTKEEERREKREVTKSKMDGDIISLFEPVSKI